MSELRRRTIATRVAIGITAYCVAVAIWSVAAYRSTDEPNRDQLDISRGAPVAENSPTEDHLAWTFQLLNGTPTHGDEVELRLSANFEAAVSAQEFTSLTSSLARTSPFEFLGMRVDDESQTAVALITDASDNPYLLEIAVRGRGAASEIDSLLIRHVMPANGPYSLGQFTLRLIALAALLGATWAAWSIGRFRLVLGLSLTSFVWVAQFGELGQSTLVYTAGLIAAPLALSGLGLLVVTLAGPTTTRTSLASSALKRFSGVAIIVSGIAASGPLTAIDTTVVSLPRQLLLIEPDFGRATSLAGASGALVAIAAASLAFFALLQLLKPGGPAQRGQQGLLTGALISSGFMLLVVFGRYATSEPADLSHSALLSVCVLTASVGLVVTTLWQHYDVAPVAVQLEAENTTLQAELAAQVTELRESRSRIVHAASEARRQIERDLHDGAQQRLVSALLSVQLARDQFAQNNPELDTFLDGLSMELGHAASELRSLSRGVHTPLLQQGIVAAVHSLAERSPIPTQVDALYECVCEQDVSQAAYFVVSEAITNASRHSSASIIVITIRCAEETLKVEICDDGSGGAFAGGGTGLVNLEDRVNALGGVWSLESEPGEGTVIRVELPCES